jgi:hypothetical protein
MIETETIATTETVEVKEHTGIKNFKNNTEVEAFYRFIHDNNLRNEAEILMRLVHNQLTSKKRKKSLQ